MSESNGTSGTAKMWIVTRKEVVKFLNSSNFQYEAESRERAIISLGNSEAATPILLREACDKLDKLLLNSKEEQEKLDRIWIVEWKARFEYGFKFWMLGLESKHGECPLKLQEFFWGILWDRTAWLGQGRHEFTFRYRGHARVPVVNGKSKKAKLLRSLRHKWLKQRSQFWVSP